MKALKSKVKIKTEHQEQCEFVEWWRLKFPHIRIFSVPNGIRTGFKQAIKAKREGLSSGVCDLFVLHDGFKLAIEFKRSKGGAVSPEQKDWHSYLSEHCGMNVIIARGCSDGVKQVMDLLTNKNSN